MKRQFIGIIIEGESEYTGNKYRQEHMIAYEEIVVCEIRNAELVIECRRADWQSETMSFFLSEIIAITSHKLNARNFATHVHTGVNSLRKFNLEVKKEIVEKNEEAMNRD